MSLETFGYGLEFEAGSLIIAETIVQIFDWMLLDIFAYGAEPRALKTALYTINNLEMVLVNLLPNYE